MVDIQAELFSKIATALREKFPGISVGDEEINLYSSMQNLNAFLNKAFFKWCEARRIDPDSVENNPRMFTWFPDPDKKAVQEKD